MLRRILWVVAVIVTVLTGFAILDMRQAARRRELWAEATD